ncbi:MAG: hypothetical protein GY787_03335 [Alteromonadales bacterium]|nr:hypothetical protein [Alteromonadales bacterium]|tara:strand:+ start:1426 stop:1626 length:201 start_codon:yes stop_codon:yes gene_type:complete
MEKQYDLEGFTLREIRALRVALDTININGIDAAFIRDLQVKINTHIQSIESGLVEDENPSQEVGTP